METQGQKQRKREIPDRLDSGELPHGSVVKDIFIEKRDPDKTTGESEMSSG